MKELINSPKGTQTLQTTQTPTQRKMIIRLMTPPSSILPRKDLFTQLLQQQQLKAQGLRFPSSDSYASQGQEQESCSMKIISNNWKNSDMRKRRRKNNQQLKFLKNEYAKCQIWDKEKISKISRQTGLSQSQVYKWCWDQKKKGKQAYSDDEQIQRTCRPLKRQNLFYY